MSATEPAIWAAHDALTDLALVLSGSAVPAPTLMESSGVTGAEAVWYVDTTREARDITWALVGLLPDLPRWQQTLYPGGRCTRRLATSHGGVALRILVWGGGPVRAVPASPRNTVRFRLHEAAQAIGRLPHGAPLPDAAEVTRTRVVLCWEAAPGGGAPTAHRLLPDDDAWRIDESDLTVTYDASGYGVGLSVVEAKVVPDRPRPVPVPQPAEVAAVLGGDYTTTVEGAEACARADADEPAWDVPGVTGLDWHDRAELRADR